MEVGRAPLVLFRLGRHLRDRPLSLLSDGEVRQQLRVSRRSIVEKGDGCALLMRRDGASRFVGSHGFKGHGPLGTKECRANTPLQSLALLQSHKPQGNSVKKACWRSGLDGREISNCGSAWVRNLAWSVRGL